MSKRLTRRESYGQDPGLSVQARLSYVLVTAKMSKLQRVNQTELYLFPTHVRHATWVGKGLAHCSHSRTKTDGGPISAHALMHTVS